VASIGANTANVATLLGKNLDKGGGALCAPAGRMTTAPAEVEELTEKIIGCAIEVHRILGPGLLESVYRECLIIEMRSHGLRVTGERHLPLDYKGQRVGGGLKLDLLVDDCVIVELKAVERLHSIHLAQVITYLKISGYPAGLLMNFNSTTLRAGLRRLDHPDRYVKKTC
jgi:GxxExxY protein